MTKTTEAVSTEDENNKQPSIHQLQQTISLLQIILLKLSGIEFTNSKT